jgi:hypothetical protein
MKADRRPFDRVRLAECLNMLTITRKLAALVDELGEEAKAAGFDPGTQMLDFILDVVNREQTSKPNAYEASKPNPNHTLRARLTEILDSGWDFSDLYWPHEGMEFCSEDGNVLDLTEAELTEQQRKLLHVIEKFYKRWKYQQSKKES